MLELEVEVLLRTGVLTLGLALVLSRIHGHCSHRAGETEIFDVYRGKQREISRFLIERLRF